jgi:hypothetical protein
LIHEQAFPNTFNQTYRIDMALLRPGIYIMEISGPGIYEKKRIVKQ